MTKREILADSLLLLTALIWGCAFAVVKNALDSFPPGAIIAMRYLIAAAITGILFRRHLKELTRGDVARGALVGLLLFGAYIVQTTGLQYTTAGKNAFLTTVYVLLVPFGCALLFHQKLQKSNLIAAVMMLVGIGLLSLDGQGGGLNPGDILTLICGFLFAGHIIAVEQCQKKTNTYALIVLQFAFCALYAGLYNRIFERGMPLAFTPGSIGGLLYIAVFSTTIGMSLQNIGQSMAPASHAVILLSLESVFGVLFSCLLLGEKVTLQMGVGFAIILAALLVSELAPGKKIDARIRCGIINLKNRVSFSRLGFFIYQLGAFMLYS
ncbi:MAG: DMT family transporter [Christensenellales bacterium]